MRYPPEHKEATRRRIIQRAARLFRQRGYAGVSIDTLMNDAGLTRGGFYSYFKNKADLFACAVEFEPEFTQRLQEREATDKRGLRDEGIAIAQNYVSKAYRKQVLKGCAMASLAMETSRAPAQAQRRYAAVIRDLVAEFSRGLKDSDRSAASGEAETLDDRALQAITTAIGGLLLANATAADTELADRISEAAQAQIAEVLARP